MPSANRVSIDPIGLDRIVRLLGRPVTVLADSFNVLIQASGERVRISPEVRPAASPNPWDEAITVAVREQGPGLESSDRSQYPVRIDTEILETVFVVETCLVFTKAPTDKDMRGAAKQLWKRVARIGQGKPHPHTGATALQSLISRSQGYRQILSPPDTLDEAMGFPMDVNLVQSGLLLGLGGEYLPAFSPGNMFCFALPPLYRSTKLKWESLVDQYADQYAFVPKAMQP